MNTDILEHLNDGQRQAVLYDGGSSLIIAGAGSGKPRVLTHKIAYNSYRRDKYLGGLSLYTIFTQVSVNKGCQYE